MRQSQPAPTARGSRWTSAMETCRPRALRGGRPPTARNQGTRANTKRAAQSPPQGHRTATHSPPRYERATDRSSTRVSPNPGSNRIVACAKLNDARALHRRSPNHPRPARSHGTKRSSPSCPCHHGCSARHCGAPRHARDTAERNDLESLRGVLRSAGRSPERLDPATLRSRAPVTAGAC